ncbi:MAG: hypothetical protein JSV34_05925 [Candidatus Omnitrophota bacterium]|nr:MAG: hypothetical protein JSV34_05925 [Candidatus Omnitrophota bacterium]
MKRLWGMAIVLGGSVMMAAIVLAAQVAVTTSGREVILENNGTWRYVDEDEEGQEVVRMNEQVKDDLRYYIQRKDSLFAKRFDIHIDWGLSYEEKYMQVMEEFYAIWDSHHNKRFFDELARSFGSKKAEKIIWILEKWRLWMGFCR